MIESRAEMKANLFPWLNENGHQVEVKVLASSEEGKATIEEVSVKRLDRDVMFTHTEWLRLVKAVADLARGAKDTLNTKD